MVFQGKDTKFWGQGRRVTINEKNLEILRLKRMNDKTFTH